LCLCGIFATSQATAVNSLTSAFFKNNKKLPDYVQIEFKNLSPEQSDLLVAILNNIGFEGFEEGAGSLKAFIISINYEEETLNEIAQRHEVDYQKTIIEETNWNLVWESNFQPVIIDDWIHGTPWVAIRAHFHEPIRGVEHEIVITPKMSFGTGHHATTWMMIQQMGEIDFNNKTVFDFGTGTGILAILAEKLGAANVTAIDNDDWSIENARENLQRNNSSKVEVKMAGNASGDERYDIILANINKNVIVDNFPSLVSQLVPGGVMLISGLLVEDEEEIITEARKFSVKTSKKTEYNNWISIRYNN
jgi:ribosomal protein L11 methyltransferase